MSQGSEEKPNSAMKIMVFRPTYEEFKNFSGYIEYMEQCGAHLGGVAKVIPPPEWVPRKSGYNIDDINMTLTTPVLQTIRGKQGEYQLYNVQKRSITLQQYKELAESTRHQAPPHFDYDDLEEKYWKNVTYISPLYAADVKGSLSDPELDVWNINKLNTILDYVTKDYGIQIDGVNTAYLYFGMYKSTFPWHTEDMDLYSINYLHFGAPKTWYSIPPAFGRKFEKLANQLFNENYQDCNAFLRHKMTLISPKVLQRNKIPVNKITQEEGEIMITFPYGYHAGFNHGYNCAESTNFASERWVEYGKRASLCKCHGDVVKISMETFVKRFQPDHYANWLKGIDYGWHPEEPEKLCPALPPTFNTNYNSSKRKPSEYSKRSKSLVSKQKTELQKRKCCVLPTIEEPLHLPNLAKQVDNSSKRKPFDSSENSMRSKSPSSKQKNKVQKRKCCALPAIEEPLRLPNFEKQPKVMLARLPLLENFIGKNAGKENRLRTPSNGIIKNTNGEANN